MKSFFPWFGALLISLSTVVSLMSYNRVDDEPISSVGTQIWRSLVYPNAFFHKTTKWNLVSLRILPCCEIWQKATQSFKSGAGWQGQTDIHPPTHPSAPFPFTARLLGTNKRSELCPVMPVQLRLEGQDHGLFLKPGSTRCFLPEASDAHVQHAVIKTGSCSPRTGKKN